MIGMKKVVKAGLINFLGGFFLLLGIAGVILPLLPATPFLLLSGFFFSKGSPKFHHWLLNHQYFGPPIRDWEQRGVIRKSNKFLASLMLAVSAVVMLPNPKIPLAGKVSFALLAISILFFIWTRPSD